MHKDEKLTDEITFAYCLHRKYALLLFAGNFESIYQLNILLFNMKILLALQKNFF